MKKKWTPSDLVDLEHFLHQDRIRLEKGERGALSSRDREFFLSIKPQNFASEQEKKAVLWHWLAARKEHYQSASPNPLPGTILEELFTLSGSILILLGFLGGFGAALPFLNYTGDEPLNALLFFSVFILLQLALIFFQLIFIGARSTGLSPMKGYFISSWLNRWVEKGLQRKFFARKEYESYQWEQVFVRLSPIIFWRVFILLQISGVCFNAGVLASLLTKITLFDTAFGWQSSLQISEDILATFVQAVAYPWSWLVPEAIAYPDIEALRGSRIILKDGIGKLSNQALISWWPFLCFSLLFYGAFPRLLLFWFGKRRLTVFIHDEPSLHQPDIINLFQRMISPVIESEGRTVLAEEQEEETDTSSLDRGVKIGTVKEKERGLLVIPSELSSLMPADKLIGFLEKTYPGVSFEKQCVLYDPDEEMKTVHEIEKYKEIDFLGILQEGWQPPIEEVLSFIRLIRATIGDSPKLYIFLVGKPTLGEVLTEATELECEIWNNKLAALQDQSLEIIAFQYTK